MTGKLELGFDERCLLAAYERICGEPYPCDGSAESHARMQAVAYLLQMAGLDFSDDCCFTWNGWLYDEARARGGMLV